MTMSGYDDSTWPCSALVLMPRKVIRVLSPRVTVVFPPDETAVVSTVAASLAP